LQHLARNEKIQRIRAELRAEMDAPGVDREPIRHFLQLLSERTRDRWRHLFLTTNWDFLLQREIDEFLPDCPHWLRDTQVFHVNGTVEDQTDGGNSNRGSFLLTEDSVQERTWSVEASSAFSHMIWASTFVVVGMSFECRIDRFLLALLSSVKETLPSGESDWIIVDPNQAALDVLHDRIQVALPRSNVTSVCEKFTHWQDAQFPELKMKGVFS
jgi:hypothetical protein